MSDRWDFFISIPYYECDRISRRFLKIKLHNCKKKRRRPLLSECLKSVSMMRKLVFIKWTIHELYISDSPSLYQIQLSFKSNYLQNSTVTLYVDSLQHRKVVSNNHFLHLMPITRFCTQKHKFIWLMVETTFRQENKLSDSKILNAVH